METMDISAQTLDFLEEGTMDGQRKKELRERVNRCCCSYCGSSLVLRRITAGVADEGRIEIFCPSCNRIEYGISRKFFGRHNIMCKRCGLIIILIWMIVSARTE